MTKSADKPRAPRRRAERLGRSPVTGHYILKPVAGPLVSSEADIREAVRKVLAERRVDG